MTHEGVAPAVNDNAVHLTIPTGVELQEALKRSRALHASSAEVYRHWDHPMNDLVERHLRLRDALRRGQEEFNDQAVHGTPITPKHLLTQMQGASFCVCYNNREQLEDVIPLLAPTSILLLDNGAYPAWRKGVQCDEAHWDEFWAWVVPILDAIPQAVAVVPDVIGGSVEENVRQYQEMPVEAWGRESQMMMVWHLDEPLDVLEYFLASGFGRIAFGSAGEYRAVGTPLWRARVKAAFDHIESLVSDLRNGYCWPRVHMMRGLAQLLKMEFPFDSADSTNIALNHGYLKGTSVEAERVMVMRRRLEAGVFPSPPVAMWPASSREPVAFKVAAKPAKPLQHDLFVL